MRLCAHPTNGDDFVWVKGVYGFQSSTIAAALNVSTKTVARTAKRDDGDADR